LSPPACRRGARGSGLMRGAASDVPPEPRSCGRRRPLFERSPARDAASNHITPPAQLLPQLLPTP
jgi:hypothetical protein